MIFITICMEMNNIKIRRLLPSFLIQLGGGIVSKYIFLGGIVVISFLTKNKSFAIGAFICLIVSFIQIKTLDNFIEKNFLNIGMIILSIWMLYPIINMESLNYKSVITLNGVIAFIAGILAAVLASKGLIFTKGSSDVITGVILGTVVGVSIFKGIPIGPLIASGIAFVFVSIINIFKWWLLSFFHNIDFVYLLW